jgi:hypothetical protein
MADIKISELAELETPADADLLAIVDDSEAVEEQTKHITWANAKLALEEAFTPRIQSMISSRLEEEEDEMEMDSEMEMEPEMGMDSEMGMPGTDVGNLSIDIDQDGQFDEFDIMPKPEAAMPGEEMPGEEMPAEEMPAEDEIEEYDLSEILRQLDEEDEMEMEMEMEPEMTMEMDMEDEEIDIDSLLEELMNEEEEKEDEKDHSKEKMMEEENEALKADLQEAYNVIKTMKDSLNEVNMLNAKLLFTNKLFKAHNLNEGQKIKVIDNFDRAKTIREVKLVYATIAESLTQKKSLVKESVASKPIASTKPKQIILTESEQIANRFKKLAGLGK